MAGELLGLFLGVGGIIGVGVVLLVLVFAGFILLDLWDFLAESIGLFVVAVIRRIFGTQEGGA